MLDHFYSVSGGTLHANPNIHENPEAHETNPWRKSLDKRGHLKSVFSGIRPEDIDLNYITWLWQKPSALLFEAAQPKKGRGSMGRYGHRLSSVSD